MLIHWHGGCSAVLVDSPRSTQKSTMAPKPLEDAVSTAIGFDLMAQSAQPTVLVVEDEADLRQLIADSLEQKGFAVAQSVDAADAIARLEGFAYDGLVVDL